MEALESNILSLSFDALTFFYEFHKKGGCDMKNQLKRLTFFTILLFGPVFLVTSAPAQDVANGILTAPSPGGFAILGAIDPAINGPWLEFAFSTVGTPATGCYPADSAGPGCSSSSGLNSVFLDAPPWTFTTPYGGAILKITDAFLYGDEFEVFDFDSSILITPDVPIDGSCGSDPENCYPDPASSSASFSLSPGPYSITIQPTASPFSAGAAYFRVDNNGFEVDIDIKFCSDPNAFNCKKKGKVPVTIFGTENFDVYQVDILTLKLCTDITGTTCTFAPSAWSIQDRGDPTTDLGAAQCEIVDDIEMDYLNPDGYDDLDVAFDSQEVALLIGCSNLDKNDSSGPLVLVGNLLDGTPFYSTPIGDDGIDQLVIKNK